MTTKRRTVTRPPATKPSRIQVGDHNSYRLEPARSRTHYGEHRLHSGGIPYGYRTKKADDAWFVVSTLNGKVYGLIEQWNDGDWTFSKVESHVEAPRWLRPAMDGAVGNMIYNLETRLHSGATPAEAIAHGLFIPMTAVPEAQAQTGKSTDQLRRPQVAARSCAGTMADGSGCSELGGWPRGRAMRPWQLHVGDPARPSVN